MYIADFVFIGIVIAIAIYFGFFTKEKRASRMYQLIGELQAHGERIVRDDRLPKHFREIELRKLQNKFNNLNDICKRNGFPAAQDYAETCSKEMSNKISNF